MTSKRIMVVDDEPVMRDSLAAWLREDGLVVETAASGEEALEHAAAEPHAVYFVDLRMDPGIDGIETMRRLHRIRADATVVIVTAYATVDTAIEAMKEGAADYIVKPCSPEEISLLVHRLLKIRDLERENVILRRRLSRRIRFHDIISKNPRMHEIFELVRQVAPLRSTVLIQGESGTGKELIARAIHEASDRARQRFVAVSCGALAETLLESELFGHEQGSFTGASRQRKGKFELADGGTLFLDEIGDIPPKLQVDLLRVLQDRRFFRVGGNEEITADVRIIAATHEHLGETVREGRFREDLFYRLNVITIDLPPLRDRREDVPLLANHFLEKFALELGRDTSGIADDAMRRLVDHDWPGNVRELENAIERAMVTCKLPVLHADDLAFLGVGRGGPPSERFELPAGISLRQLERQAIVAALERSRGNVSEAAAILGIDRSTLYDKLKRYGIVLARE